MLKDGDNSSNPKETECLLLIQSDMPKIVYMLHLRIRISTKIPTKEIIDRPT